MSIIEFTHDGETVSLDLSNVAKFIEAFIQAAQGLWEWLKSLFTGAGEAEPLLHAV